ncbi:VTT domain-containing protein [Oxalobacteraceae bacterium R-40]|uniref:VTT domain-containing protein n=1 Tax=Keguizhuia sedimenti TaxID=3064264 RepID=A0ABU1BRE3_9BURK|nr:VTT domain-containing protein [Oxalobacteraceae bacterium R-40]
MSLNKSPENIVGSAERLLQAGRNCWRIENAQRFSLLVDADIYFRAVRQAILAAKHSIFILSWDIDSRMWLMPGGANDGYPEPLGDFLHAVVSSRPDLHAYVLNWDFAMLYALEREWLPVYKLDWRTHRRLEFKMDARHPIGASHHQKIVVIDDKLAFVGGLDLTRSRWDTPEHACNAPLRRDTDGKEYGPFHDVQCMVDGDAASALGELSRSRWQRAVKQMPIPFKESDHDPWPQGITPDLTDVEIAISRTEPGFEREPAVHEIKQLHLDAIAAAKKFLFFENQYFTSGLIAHALGFRLKEPDGPEVAIISPQTQSGWLEDVTMGVLRARSHRHLVSTDEYGHYALYCPHIPGLKEGCLNVHSKVFAVDDSLFSVGSANLSSRSMAYDTECNLTIEAVGDQAARSRISASIAHMRNRLLAEHLDTTPERVAEEIVRQGSMHRAIEALQSPGRSLQVLNPVVTPELDALIPDQAFFDPERPIDPDELVAQFVPKDARKPVPKRLIGLGLLAITLALLAIAWRWTPMREWINLDSLIGLARSLENMPFTPIAVVGSYVLAGLLMVPVMLLIAVTGIVFGPLWGMGYAVAGSLLSASVAYGIGMWLGRETVRRMLGARVNRLSRRIAKRGIIAMTVIRMLPIAPFTVVNIVAGASHIRFRDYLIGTFLGMVPGIFITVTFVHNLAEAVRNPSIGTVSVLAGVAILLISAAIFAKRMLTRKNDISI